MSKSLDEMNIVELNALPEFREFYYVEVEDFGKRIRHPRRRERQAFFVGPTTPLTWPDTKGGMWQPVMTPQGWMKERV